MSDKITNRDMDEAANQMLDETMEVNKIWPDETERAREQEEKDSFVEELKESIARLCFSTDPMYAKISDIDEILRMIDTLADWEIE